MCVCVDVSFSRPGKCSPVYSLGFLGVVMLFCVTKGVCLGTDGGFIFAHSLTREQL